MDKYDPEYVDAEEAGLIESIGEIDPGSLQNPSEGEEDSGDS